VHDIRDQRRLSFHDPLVEDALRHLLGELHRRGRLGPRPRLLELLGGGRFAAGTRNGLLVGPHRGRAGQPGEHALADGGALLTGLGRRRRTAALGGAALVLAGEVCLRWSVFRAGFQSARDPKYTVEPQRRRLEARESASEEPEAGLQPSSSFRSSRTSWTTS
jgi:hypothetical protein